jgi:CHAT domain-containing protein
LKEKAILIAMPTTLGKATLPNVKTEVKGLETLLLKAFIETTVMENPKRTMILSELSKYTIVHFACHGNCEEDPSQSYFHLEDMHLTVSDITSLNIESAKMAYLSACHTSAMRNFRLLDESISLSSAIQLSGYPSVVGSLWGVNDRHSAWIARDVYASILRDQREFDARRSADALHKAVRDLRDKTRFMRKHDPLVWAPFIHIGI